MPRYYKLRNRYLTNTRVESLIKKVITEEQADRDKATEAFDFFMDLVKKDPANDSSINAAIKFFQQVLNVKSKTTKIIEIYLKNVMTPKALASRTKEEMSTEKETKSSPLDYFNFNKSFIDDEDGEA